MSGIYIPGMEMPKHCWSCCFHDEVDDCIILKESCMTVWGEQKRLDNCPLISVPDHGYLIDRSQAVVEEDTYYQCYNIIAPTIIPAEGGDAE